MEKTFGCSVIYFIHTKDLKRLHIVYYNNNKHTGTHNKKYIELNFQDILINCDLRIDVLIF